MKFSELEEASWPDLQPYMDTCLLPVTGLEGGEAPYEMADLAAEAGAWLAPLEHAFKGRTVTLPAYHYYDGSEEEARRLSRISGKCRSAGFRFVVLVSGRAGLLTGIEGADLIVQPNLAGERPDAGTMRKAFTDMWRGAAQARSGANDADMRGGE